MFVTEEHLFLRPNADGTLGVGITDEGDSLMGGITYIDRLADDEVSVEGVKACLYIKIPVCGTLVMDSNAFASGEPFAHYEPGYEIDLDKVKEVEG